MVAGTGARADEKQMFGGLAFLVGGNMSVAASGQGGILVRVDPDESDTLLAEPGAGPMEMGGRGAMRGWLRVDGRTVREEQELYLEQPAYGTSYITGKLQFEALLSERKNQLGEKFDMREFMDHFHAAGLIPTSLLRWELSGKLPADVKAMLEDPR